MDITRRNRDTKKQNIPPKVVTKVFETKEEKSELKVNEKRIFNYYIDSDALTKDGIIEVKQKKFPNTIEINLGSGREITVKNSEKRVDVFAPNMHLWIEEIDTGDRRVTLATFDELQRIQAKSIVIGNNSPTGNLGNFNLNYGKDGQLEVSMKRVDLREQDKMIFRGAGEDRELIYEYIDNYEHRNNYEVRISSINNSSKITSNENKERIIALELEKFGELHGGTRGVIRIIPEIIAPETIVTQIIAPDITVGA